MQIAFAPAGEEFILSNLHSALLDLLLKLVMNLFDVFLVEERWKLTGVQDAVDILEENFLLDVFVGKCENELLVINAESLEHGAEVFLPVECTVVSVNLNLVLGAVVDKDGELGDGFAAISTKTDQEPVTLGLSNDAGYSAQVLDHVVEEEEIHFLATASGRVELLQDLLKSRLHVFLRLALLVNGLDGVEHHEVVEHDLLRVANLLQFDEWLRSFAIAGLLKAFFYEQLLVIVIYESISKYSHALVDPEPLESTKLVLLLADSLGGHTQHALDNLRDLTDVE